MPPARPRAAAALTLMIGALVVAGGCGAGEATVERPFVALGHVENGPGSGLWGDGSTGPSGAHVGCIRGRRFAVLITVHNRTRRTVTLIGGGGPEPFRRVIERVAVQVRLAPPPPNGNLFVGGLRGWSRHDSPPVSVPPGRDAWVQSNFLMKSCSLLRSIEPAIVNRSTTLRYSVGAAERVQVVSLAGARIILTRGPRHPSLPINQVG